MVFKRQYCHSTIIKFKMNKEMKDRTRFNAYNDNMKLNNRTPVSYQEYEDLERFERAYVGELSRLKRKRKSGKAILMVVGIVVVFIALTLGNDVVLSLIKSVLR